MNKPAKPTKLKKLLFTCTASDKKQALSDAIRAHFKARGEKPRRHINGKELMSVLKEILVLKDFKYDTSTGTLSLDVKENYFSEREDAYKTALAKWKASDKKRKAAFAKQKALGLKLQKERQAKVEAANYAKKVFIAGVKREQGWLYYLDKNCNVARSRIVGGGRRRRQGNKIEVIIKTDIGCREDGFLYYIDKQGDVSRTKISRGGTARKKRKKATTKKRMISLQPPV